jgi:hypothetical protein
VAKREQSRREKALRRYFFGRAPKGAIWMIVIAVFLCAGGFVLAEDTDGLSIIPGALIGGLGILGFLVWILNGGLSVPSDRKVDEWFAEAVARFEQQSLDKLGFVENEVVGEEPLLIVGPIVWSTHGIEDEDICWRVGKDDIIRFGVYRVTVVQLTDRQLGAYACDYNFIRDVALNEETDEYHYQDIVSVSTKEAATSYTLPTGVKLTSAQQFRISVSSGEAIEVVVDFPKLSELTGGNKIPETGSEKAVSVIRAMLREKKP